MCVIRSWPLDPKGEHPAAPKSPEGDFHSAFSAFSAFSASPAFSAHIFTYLSLLIQSKHEGKDHIRAYQ